MTHITRKQNQPLPTYGTYALAGFSTHLSVTCSDAPILLFRFQYDITVTMLKFEAFEGQ